MSLGFGLLPPAGVDIIFGVLFIPALQQQQASRPLEPSMSGGQQQQQQPPQRGIRRGLSAPRMYASPEDQ